MVFDYRRRTGKISFYERQRAAASLLYEWNTHKGFFMFIKLNGCKGLNRVRLNDQSRPPAKPEACSALKGHHTGGAESPPNHLPTASGHKLLSGWLFSASFHWLTRRRVYQFFYSHLFIRYIFLHLIPYVFSYCLFPLSLLYLHNILDTNTLCFRFGISCLHVGQISSGYFFLLSIP